MVEILLVTFLLFDDEIVNVMKWKEKREKAGHKQLCINFVNLVFSLIHTNAFSFSFLSTFHCNSFCYPIRITTNKEKKNRKMTSGYKYF